MLTRSNIINRMNRRIRLPQRQYADYKYDEMNRGEPGDMPPSLRSASILTTFRINVPFNFLIAVDLLLLASIGGSLRVRLSS